MRRVPLWLIPVLPLLVALLGVPVLLYLVEHQNKQARAAVQRNLQLVAGTVATLLAEDGRFLALGGDQAGNSYRSRRLAGELVLDGRVDDWPAMPAFENAREQVLELYQPYDPGSFSYELRMANDDGSLYLHYAVLDDTVVYREASQLSVHRNDHVQLAMLDPSGVLRRYTIAAIEPGEINALEVSPTGRALRTEDGIEGRWMATGAGYQLELKVDRGLLTGQFATLVADVDDGASRSIKYLVGLNDTQSANSLGRIVYSPSALDLLLQELPYAVQVLDHAGNSLIEVASPALSGLTAEAEIAAGTAEPLRVIVGADFQEALLFSAGPMIIAMLTAVAAGCLGAAWLYHRRLLRVRERLLDDVVEFQGPASGDALDMLASDIERLLQRMSQHNDYLEKMAARLNHELRTPVSVVKSSLESLQMDSAGSDSRIYVERAIEGVSRLTKILNRMSEARRLEESLDQDEIVRFNLAELVSGCVEGYKLAFPDIRFDLIIETADIAVTGIPEMFAQLLDKLIDNAAEFAATPEIRVELTVENGVARLRVMNEGSALPQQMTGQLFDAMVSVRNEQVETHLGLGLFVARLIAEFHGAAISIANRDDAAGVVVLVEVPLLRITSKLR